MPLYSYACTTGHHQRDIFKPLVELDRQELCAVCESPMTRLITAARVVADYPGYECPVTGAWVEGRAAHRENLARTGCRILEPGETREAARRREAEDLALDASIEQTAAEFVEALPQPKKEALACALDHGLDVTFERT